MIFPVPSAFVSALVRLDYPGLGFDVAGETGKVVAVRVFAVTAATGRTPPP